MDVLHLGGMVYYIPMVQPKTPPLSVRLGEERLARIDAYAKEHALSRHLAILLMLDEGHRSLTVGVAPIVAAIPEKVEKLKAAKPAFKSRLKGEWKAP